MDKNKEAVVFGCSSFGEIVDFYLTHDSDYDVIGFCESDESYSSPEFRSKPVFRFSELEKKVSVDKVEMYIAVGYRKMNAIRKKYFEAAQALGFTLLSYVSSQATVWPGLSIGKNVFILEDNTIQPFVSIGDNNVFWSGNHIGHHTIIGSHNYITSHVVISGHCRIGNSSFFGVNATVTDSVTIADRNLIAANALVQKSTRDDEVYFGPRSTPASRQSDSFFK